jgi:hypothetical protein
MPGPALATVVGMSEKRGILAVVGAFVLVIAPVAGCAATPGTTQTIFVTETAAGTTSGTTATTTGSPSSVSSGTSTSATSSISGATRTTATTATATAATATATATGAPFVTVDPLKLDCVKLLSGSRITEIYGSGVPSGTARVVEAANPERKVKGRLKCQYGVSDDRSKIAVSVIFAQFDDVAAAKAQVLTSVQSETGLGATASKTTVQGYPADVLLRDGGFLIMNYDTWNLSVVVADNLLAEAQLPDALADTAQAALTNAIS